MRWERERAINYLLALDAAEVPNGVDRYIIWPGQALAYMTGKRELMDLQEEARRALGSRFDLRGFHDMLLRHGVIPLTTFRKLISKWAGIPTVS